MGIADNTITLRIVGDSKSFKGAVDDSTGSIDKLGKSATSASKDVSAALSSISAQQKDLASQLKAGALNADGYAKSSQNLASQAKTLNAQLTSTSAIAKASAAGLNVMSGATSGVTRELGVLGGELARGNIARLEGSLITLANRAGLLGLAFTPLGGIVLATAAAVGIFALGAIAGAKETTGFNAALISTGNYAGQTSGTLRALSEQIGITTGSISKATDAVTLLAGSGKISGQSLNDAARATVSWSELTGQSIDKVVDEFTKLADDPVKQVLKLNDTYHFLTLAIYDQIKALQDQGDTQGAAALSIKALADEGEKRVAQMDAQTGTLEKGWKDVKSAIDEAVDSLKDFGRTDAQTNAKRALQNYQNVQDRNSGQSLFSVTNPLGIGTTIANLLDPASAEKDEADALAQVKAAYAALNTEREKGKEIGSEQKMAQDGIAAAASIDQLNLRFDKQAAKQQELNTLTAQFTKLWNAQQAAYAKNSNAPLDPRLANVTKTATGFSGGLYDQIAAGINKVPSSAHDAQKALELLNTEIEQGVQLAAKLADGDGKLGQAQQTLDRDSSTLKQALEALEAEKALGIVSTDDYATKYKILTDAQKNAVSQFDATTAAIGKQNDVVGNYLQKLSEQDAAEAGLTELQKLQSQAVSKLTDEWNKKTDAERAQQEALGHLNPTIQSNIDIINSATESSYNYRKAMDFARDGAKQFANEVSGGFKSAFDAVGQLLTGQIKSFKDFGNAILSSFKNVIAQMISTALQLRFLGPIMSAFGFPSAAFGGAGGVNPLAVLSSATSGGSNFFNTAGAAGTAVDSASNPGFSLFDPTSWVSAGKNLATGFSSLWNGTETVNVGAGVGDAGFGGTLAGDGGGFGGVFGGGAETGASAGVGYTPGLLGNIAAIGGGILAAYGEYKNAGGGAAGVIGGAAYGLGTVTAVGAIGGVLGGAGAAAGAAGSLGAIGLGAIPVVGWVALAAMAINMISGGKLFGTAYKPTGQSSTSFDIGGDGASVVNTIQESKQKALFGGKKYKDVTVGATDEQNAYVAAALADTKKTQQAAADALGDSVVGLISGTSKTITDKTGKVISQVSTVLGETYSESADDFIARIKAESVVAQVDFAAGGHAASDFVQAYRGTVASLADAAQLVLAAQVDIQHGIGLLGSDTNLKDIGDEVAKLQQGDEKLLDTYARLQNEVGVVKNAFDVMGITLDKSGKDLVEFADKLATAAGGSQQLQTLFSNFEQTYYSPQELAQKYVDQQRPQLQSDLGAVGLGPDTTMQQFRDAFEKQLPTLTAEQTVQWLNLATELAAFNQALAQLPDPIAKATAAAQAQAQAVLNYASLVQSLDAQIADASGHGLSDFAKALAQIGTDMHNTIGQLNDAAKAAGAQGAREEDLAKVHQLAALKAAQAARLLFAQTQDLVTQLYGGGQDSVTDAANNAAQSFSGVTDSLNQATNAAKSFKDQELIDQSLSPLSARDQLNEAIKQLQATGSADTAQRALEIARGLDASGDDYKKDFDYITSLVRQSSSTSGGGGGSFGGGGSASSKQQLSPSERASDAQQIAQNLADLSGFDGKSYADEAKALGFNLKQLGDDLGLQGNALNDYLDSLKQTSYSLDDLGNLISGQVDRIIAAITGTHQAADVSKAVGRGTYTGPKTPGTGQPITFTPGTGTPVTVTPSPKPPGSGGGTGQPPSRSGNGPATNDVIRESIGKLGDKIDKFGVAIAKVTASSGDEVAGAVRDVGSGVRDVSRNINALPIQRGNVRTQSATR